jgi:hypothetical protein
MLRFNISFCTACTVSRLKGVPLSSFFCFTEWHGIDTLIVAAGVSALRPVLEIACAEGPSETQPSLEGVQRIEDVALAAVKGNYLGPLLSVVTMVRLWSRLTSGPFGDF